MFEHVIVAWTLVILIEDEDLVPWQTRTQIYGLISGIIKSWVYNAFVLVLEIVNVSEPTTGFGILWLWSKPTVRSKNIYKV